VADPHPAEVSYKEVLDATKHQDDKVGRIITAAAFLTAGAFALITHTFADTTTLSLPDGNVPVVSIGVGLYFACTAFAVTGLLLSLATPLVLISEADPDYESLIFFHEISRLSTEQWRERWDSTEEDLRSALKKNYIREALNLSRRVRLKYKRTYLSVGVFQVGVFYLFIGAIAFLFGFVHASHLTIDQPVPIEPTYLVRTVFLLGIFAYLGLEFNAIRDQARYDRADWPDYEKEGGDKLTLLYRRRTTDRLAFASLICLLWLEAVIIMTPYGFTHWISLLVIPGGALFVWALRRFLSERCHKVRGGSWIGGLQRIQLYYLVGLGVWVSTVALGCTVSLLDSAKSRLAVSAAIPLVVMLVGAIVKSLPRVPRPSSAVPLSMDGNGSSQATSPTGTPDPRHHRQPEDSATPADSGGEIGGK
jgi:hypothetical protein